MELEQKAFEELTELSKKLIHGCEKTAFDGTVLYTPDGVGNYDALWVRDFGYMAEYCGDLLGPAAIESCLDFILTGQREDGWLPDRIEATGEAVYAAGAKGFPIGKANLDNTPFFVFAAYSYWRLCQPAFREHALTKLTAWIPAMIRGLDCLPISEEGLVYNDPQASHSPYGFTDTVCKTGQLYMESLLYWRACRQLESLLEACSFSKQERETFRKKAQQVETAIYNLYSDLSGIFYAADGLCRQPDIWGMAYMLSIGFPLAPAVQSQVEQWLVAHSEEYLYRGQVCHLPGGEAWEKLLIPVEPGEYQNGAYWATASGWVWQVLRKNAPEKAASLITDLLNDFREGEACECINQGYRKLPKFVVSATNIRGALKEWLGQSPKHGEEFIPC